MATKYDNIGTIYYGEYIVLNDSNLSFDTFKDEEAYKNNWNKVCYIPENGWIDCKPRKIEIDGKEVEAYDLVEFDTIAFSHNDLLDIVNYNCDLCDSLFDRVEWECPECTLEDWFAMNFGVDEYYDLFVRPGARVWWTDPQRKTSGQYVIYEVRYEDEEEPYLYIDTMILIGNEHSEAEVNLYELCSLSDYKQFMKHKND